MIAPYSSVSSVCLQVCSEDFGLIGTTYGTGQADVPLSARIGATYGIERAVTLRDAA